ncbi:MAG: V-type ATPase subunit [Oscillospiraceae bacterium]|jgi:V/A-type H+-transporting ATPase subunit C|nr:V-type ATPase subunit [Oscillospiraceae bacterium]
MTGDLSRYGAVTSKIRAMFGNRLRREDYDRIAVMKSVSEVADYLRAHPDWGRALESVDTVALRRDRLETLLRRHSFAHFLRLFAYVERRDRLVMRYPVLTAEMEQIMRVTSLASSGNIGEYTFELPEYFKKFSRIQYNMLSSVRTYDDLLEAVKYTDFHTALERLRPLGGEFPSYFLIETQMRRSYYRSVGEMLRGRKGKAGVLLREATGIQADWENITTVERILRFYPSLLSDVFHYLVPAGAHLKPVELKTMLSLEDADSLREILKKTYYGPFLEGRDGDTLEKIGQLFLMGYYRRQMAGGTPSVFMPIAYINLYRNELNNLVHIIESVRYGLAPEITEKYLILL